MKTRYFNAAETVIEVTLDPGERVGSYVSVAANLPPVKFTVFLNPPNQEADQLLALIAHDQAPQPDAYSAAGSQAIEFSVSSAQALIQLSRMPHDGSVVPGATNLAEATERLVEQSDDYELKTWFARAQRWLLGSPNVLKLGTAFNLSPDKIRAAFEAAAKIEE